ncbi:MAG: peptide-methionine (S)-S-oxide reductase MsrA, partial [Pseudomonadota bacterium]
LFAAIAGTATTMTTYYMSAGAQDKPDLSIAQNYETAIFAGGCFWCVEADFDKVDGVIQTTSGYTGGMSSNPTYKTHTKQGHIEAVRVTYDPEQVSYPELVDYFMRHIDPTDDGGQFCDRGNSYTTAVFVDTPEQRDAVKAEFEEIEASGNLPAPIVTKIRDVAPFYNAEKNHQDFYMKNPVRYKFYRQGCKRDERLREVWSVRGDS